MENKCTEYINNRISDSGMKIIHLSKITGIPYIRLTRILNGERRLYSDELFEICRALRINPTNIMKYEKGA